MENQSKKPIRIGFPEQQEKFIKRHPEFVPWFYENQEFITQCFNDAEVIGNARSPLNSPGDPLYGTPPSPNLADIAVFYLIRGACEDFVELFLLAANGKSSGATKLLRTLYEKVVHAAYLSQHPSQTVEYFEDEHIKRWKLWRELADSFPSVRVEFEQQHKDFVVEIERDYNNAKIKRKDSICSKCHQPKTQEAWTLATLPTMAKKAGRDLDKLIFSCYLLPTFHIHATSYSIGQHIKETDAGDLVYVPTSESGADNALYNGYFLVLRALNVLNAHFQLSRDSVLEEKTKEFWKIHAIENSESKS